MERKRLLYLFASAARPSPFDINMAYDAGFDAVIPYAGVEVSAVPGLVQDIMFSRGPKGARATGIFLSGTDLGTTEALLRAAKGALFDPFRVSLMADPQGGGYTTAAALFAKVAALARARGPGEIGRLRVLVAAGTGTVGRAAATLAALEGAGVTLTSRRPEGAAAAARDIADRFGATIEPRTATGEADLERLSAGADIILATGAAGARLLSQRALASLGGPKIVADVNAVPPHGLEGVKPQDDGAEIAPGILGLGALAIGGLKFEVEASLLRDLVGAGKPLVIDLRAARERAEQLLRAR